MKRLLFFGFVFSIFITTYSQQLPTYSQYTMTGYLINPAMAGNEGYTAFGFLAREQWLGVPNSPKTHALTFETRVLKSSFISRKSSIKKKKKRNTRSGRVGVGAYVFNDQFGHISRTGTQFTYAYHIPIKDHQLSFGLSLTTYQFKLKFTSDDYRDQLDDLLLTTDKNLFIPDFNFGVFYKSPDYYAGLSVSDLSQASLKVSDRYSSPHKMNRHYYLFGGYKYIIDKDFLIEPSIMMKTTEKLAFQTELTAKCYYKGEYWGGISFRTAGAMVVMLGLRVDKYYFGYAFDYNFSSIMSHTWGTHELMVALKLGDNARRYRWLNRY